MTNVTKHITIQVRSVYGANKAYPVCHAAGVFAMMAGTKTLTPATLRLVLELGFDIVIQGMGGRIIAPSPRAHQDIIALQLAA